MQKDVKNISNISLQLKYHRKIFVKYWKIFRPNIKIWIFWNSFEIK